MAKATKKQIGYLKHLLRDAGWDENFLNARWKKLGFTMSERSGRVDDLTKSQASRAIDALKELED